MRPRSPIEGSSPVGTIPNSETMAVWVEGLDRGEANQRPAPMTRAVFGGQVVDESEDKDEEGHAGGSKDRDEDEIEGGDDSGDYPKASSEEDKLEEDL